MLVEAMANGIISLNYSANIAMDEEFKADALKRGKSLEEYESEKKKDETIDWATYITIGTSLVFGIALFVFVPHAATEGINKTFSLGMNLEGVYFHFIDGVIKAMVFILYIKVISLLPDIKRVFQYHGAEHKSISTFEAGDDLTVENARKHSIFHPRCGTSFLFFLLFVSIIIFSGVFTVIPIGQGLPDIPKHVLAVIVKILFMVPIAGISYEIIKFAGKHSDKTICRVISIPGMLLQRLTTNEPDDKQLEVALSSIKAALHLEENYKLKDINKKVLKLEEVDIQSLDDIESASGTLSDFLEN